MTISVSKGGGIYIEIGGSLTKFEEALKDARRLANMSATEISKEFNGMVSTSAAREIGAKLSQAFKQAELAAKNFNADLSEFNTHFQNMGRAIGVAEKDLQRFAAIQTQALQNKNANAFTQNLKTIQRQTGYTDAQMNQLAKSLGGVGNEFIKVPPKVSGLSKQIDWFGKEIDKADPKILKMGASLKALAATYISFSALKSMVSSIGDAALQADKLARSYTAIFSTSEDGAQSLERLRAIAERTGADFNTLANSAKGFFAASVGTPLEKDMFNIIEGITVGATALGVSSQELQGIMVAVSQMAGKGVIAMQEWRQQLGEKLPVANKLMTQALGITTAELNKLISTGKFSAENLKYLGELLNKTYGGTDTGMQGSLNKLGNAWQELLVSLSNTSAAQRSLDILTSALKSLADSINDLRTNAIRMGTTMGSLGGLGLGVLMANMGAERAAAQGKAQQMLQQAVGVGRTSFPTTPQDWAQRILPQAIDTGKFKPKPILTDGGKDDKSSLRKELALDRTLTDARHQFEKARESLEQLQLKYNELEQTLSGSSLADLLNRNFKDYEAQIRSIEKMQQDLRENQEKWAKQGQLTSEVKQFIAEANAQYEEQKNKLKSILELQQQITEREYNRAQYNAGAQLSSLLGNIREYYEYQVKILDIQTQETEGLERQLVLEQQRRLIARRDVNTEELLNIGMLDQAKAAQESYLDFWQKGIPGALSQGADAFGDFFGGIVSGSTSVSDAWTNLGKTFQNITSQIISDLISAQIQMLIFGNAVKNVGQSSGWGGLLSGLGSILAGALGSSTSANWGGSAINAGRTAVSFIPSAKGNVFSNAPGLSAYSGSVVSKPTVFPFARGVGLMGEAGPEAIIPLKRTSSGRLGVEASGLSNPQQGASVNVIINNNASNTNVRQEHQIDDNGNLSLKVTVDEAVANAINNGASTRRALQGNFGAQQRTTQR